MTEFGYFDEGGVWIKRETKRYVLEMRYHLHQKPELEERRTIIGTSDDKDALEKVADELYPFMVGFCDSLILIDSEKSVYWIVGSEK